MFWASGFLFFCCVAFFRKCITHNRHQLSITADDVMQPDVVNAIHATQKFWGLSGPREAFLGAVDRAIDQVSQRVRQTR